MICKNTSGQPVIIADDLTRDIKYLSQIITNSEHG